MSFDRIAGIGLLLASLLSLSVEARAFEDAEVRSIVRHIPSQEFVRDAPGVWMARGKTVRFDGGGRATEQEHLIGRVLDAGWGRTEFSPFTQDYWSEGQTVRVLRARIWHPDLSFEDLPKDAVSDQVSPIVEGRPPFELLRRVSVEFPDPKVGDVYEIILSKSRSPRAGEFNVTWFMETFGAEVPVIEQRVEIQTPRAVTTVVETVGPPPSKGRGVAEGFDAVSFVTGNLSALPAPLEGGVFSRRATAVGADSVTTVVFSTASWRYLSTYLGEQWWKLIQELSPELSRGVGRIFSGNPDPRWRAEQLEAWVRDEIETLPISHLLRACRPLTPSQVFEARGGGPMDKAILLAASLRLAGIEATPVFVRTFDAPWAENIGCPDQFDRILVRAELAEPLWLDPIDDRPLPPGKGFVVPIVDPRRVAEDEPESTPRFIGLIDFPGR